MDLRLQDNLKNVQQDYIAPFLWLHWEEDHYIVETIERIYESGIRSICLESRTHEDFARDGWWSDVELILTECKKRDMRVWILDDKHFPTGYANGIFAEKYKHLQPWSVTERHMDVAGPVAEGAAMAGIWLETPEDEILAVLALKHVPESERYSEVLDVTEGLSGDMVYFTLPEGMWRIVFVIRTRSGYTPGSREYCDMLNPEAVEHFIEEVYEPHYARFRSYFGNTFLGFFSDEPSFKNNNAVEWAPDLGAAYMHYPWGQCVKDRLTEKYGKEAAAKIPGLWFPIGADDSTQIRYDYMDIITAAYRNNFCNKLGDWCRARNVEYIGHVIEDNQVHAKTGSGAGHYFRALEGQDMSGIDVVLQQIIPGLTECSNAGYVCYKHMDQRFFHYYLGKLGSSFAHIDPKKKGRAMCEIFGAYGWAEGSKVMKYLMDHMLVRGINYYVPHAFSPKPNDPDCPPNFFDTGRNPQYAYFRYHMDYMNRMCHMLSDGYHVPTCAILYDAENRWSNGTFLALEEVAKKLYDNLYDYDIIPADYLNRIRCGSLNGEKYHVLFVPEAEHIPEETAEQLKHAEIEVVVVTKDKLRKIDPADEKSGSPDSFAWTDDFAQIPLEELPAYMKKRGLCDVTAEYDGIYLRYYHYCRNGADIYMFSNEDINHKIHTTVSLSAFTGGKYIEYDAFENKACVKESDTSQIEITLQPYHSLLILCGQISGEGIPKAGRKVCPEQENFLQQGGEKCILLSPEYQISVAERNESHYIPYKVTHQLPNITGARELPHFSGHIKYEAEFELEKMKPGDEERDGTTGDGKQADSSCIYLDLGEVGEIAEVSVNGTYVGVKLIPPYRFDVTDVIKPGVNSLCVTVTNHNGYAVRDEFSKYMLFEPSGLLGPVTIKVRD